MLDWMTEGFEHGSNWIPMDPQNWECIWWFTPRIVSGLSSISNWTKIPKMVNDPTYSVNHQAITLVFSLFVR